MTRRTTWFPLLPYEGWPKAQDIETYFLTREGIERLYNMADSLAFRIWGVDGTEHLEQNKGRIDASLEMWTNLNLGVLMIYSKRGGKDEQICSSVGDLTRLREWTRTRHNTPMPIGLYIPFQKAWPAIREFLETDGKLPTSIEWISNAELPPNTFPDP